MADNWQPVEKVAKNEKGEFQAFSAGKWSPVAKVAKNDAGQYQALMAVGDKVSQIPDMPPEVAATPEQPQSLMDKARGIGEAGATLVTGALGAVPAHLAGIAETIKTGKYKGEESARVAENRAREFSSNTTYQPRGQAGKDYVENIAGALDKSKLAGLNPATAMELSGAIQPAAAAVRQSAGNAAQGVKNVAGGAVNAAASTIAPKISPEVASLARKAEKMGIKVPLDALGDNRVIKFLGQAFREVPLSGSMTAENRAAFNRKVMELVGGDAKSGKISPQAFDAAMTKSGKTIGDISAKNPVPLDAKLTTEFEKHALNANNFETSEVGKIVNSYLRELTESGAAKGQIDGELFRKIRTKLTTQMRSTSNGDLKHALSELDETLLDAVKGQLSPTEIKAFDTARGQYALGKTIEPLIAKAAVKGSGDMSPAAFANQLISTKSGKSMMARGHGGQAGDVAAVGNKFLTEPGSSGTAERSMAYGALGGGGLVGGLPAAATIYGAANLYNRAGPAIARKLTARDAIAPPSGIVSP